MNLSKKSSKEEMALRRLKIFRYIDFFETYLREEIQRKLEEKYGEEWWEKGVPQEAKDACTKLAEKEDSDEPLLNFAGFTEYISIITSNENWNKIFSPLFKKPLPLVKTYLIELRKLRRRAYHNRQVSDDHVREAELFVKELCVGKAISAFEKIRSGETLSHTETRIVQPLVFKLNGWGTPEEISREVGYINWNLHQLLNLMEEAGLLKHVTGAEIASGIVQGAPFIEEGRKVPSPKEPVYFLSIPQEEMLEKHPEIKDFRRR
jgi:hypothetical protein